VISGLPWEIGSFDQYKKDRGIVLIESPDPYLERLFLFRLKRDWSINNSRSLLTAELNDEWWEDFATPTLFQSELLPTLFFTSESALTKLKSILLRRDFPDVLLLFSLEEGMLAKVTPPEGALQIKVFPARFWEGDRLLQFLSAEMRFPLTNQFQDFILETIPHTTQDFVEAIKIIRQLNLGQGRYSTSELKGMLGMKRFDRFNLSSLLSRQKWLEFYSTLLNSELDFEESTSLFAFLEGHLLKLATPQALREKKKLSKYDREILDCAPLWSSLKIRDFLLRLGKWSMLAKSKSFKLKEELRLQKLALLDNR